MNPFYKAADFPDFPAMTPAAAEEALPKLLSDAKASVDALERDAPPTWDGFVRALDDATHPLTLAWGIVSHFMSVLNGEAWRKVHERFQPDLVAFSLRVGQQFRQRLLGRRRRHRGKVGKLRDFVKWIHVHLLYLAVPSLGGHFTPRVSSRRYFR